MRIQSFSSCVLLALSWPHLDNGLIVCAFGKAPFMSLCLSYLVCLPELLLGSDKMIGEKIFTKLYKCKAVGQEVTFQLLNLLFP